MNWLDRFCITLSCVTSLPVNRLQSGDSCAAGLSKYLPAVGLLIGALLVAAAQTLTTLAVSHSVAAILLVIIWLVLSGGIHFDGLMDTADGIFSHRSPERMLEIMRDSRVGNFGVIVGMVAFAIKIAGLMSVTGSLAICALLLIPAWARWCETFAIGKFRYAREEGMGKIWHDTTMYPKDLWKAAVAPVLAMIFCAVCFGAVNALAVSALTVLVGTGAAYYLASIVKGHTGDTYGAVVEIAEAGGLLLLLAVAKFL